MVPVDPIGRRFEDHQTVISTFEITVRAPSDGGLGEHFCIVSEVGCVEVELIEAYPSKLASSLLIDCWQLDILVKPQLFLLVCAI